MKKVLSVVIAIIAMVCSPVSVKAVYTHGNSIQIEGGLAHMVYHTYLGLGVYDDEFTGHGNFIYAGIRTSNAYQDFGENSKMLIRFKDGEVYEIDSFGESETHFDSFYMSTTKFNVYTAAKKYEVSDKLLQKLLSEPIVKIRITLCNGNVKDYVIKDKDGKKLVKKFNESWSKIVDAQNKRIDNANDIMNGF